LIDTAAKIGAKAVSFGLFQALTSAQTKALWFWTVQGHVDPDDPAVWAKAVSRIRELGQHAAALGIEVSLEMYEDTYLGTADSSVRFVTDVDLLNVKLNLDIGNLIRLYRPVEHWLSMVRKALVQIVDVGVKVPAAAFCGQHPNAASQTAGAARP
jgi:sugar phosphate isomerase/epimerase